MRSDNVREAEKRSMYDILFASHPDFRWPTSTLSNCQCHGIDTKTQDMMMMVSIKS